MSRTLVLIGTRKGCFALESDGDRRDWSLRGPFCESWPVYHAVYDQGSGTIFAAAASEWHGSAVWRSGDLGETWEHSSEGLTYGENGRALEGLDPGRRSWAPARRCRGAGHLREPRRRRDVLAALDARGRARKRGLGRPGQPAAGAPGHLGDRVASRRPVALLRDRAGGRPLGDDRRRRQLDASQPRAPRGLAA